MSIDDLQVSQKSVMVWCESRGRMPCYETSAKEAVNVEEAFQTLAKDVLRQLEEEADEPWVYRSSLPQY